jgi:hypothetical protein
MPARPHIPHLDLPVRAVNGVLVSVDQDSLDEIAVCVESTLRYQPGDFDPEPAFGVPDQTFRQGGADVDAVTSAVRAWEPRADALVTEDASLMGDLIETVRVDLTGTDQED